MRRKKRVMIITESFPPILNSAGRLLAELSEELAMSGLDVLVLTERPSRYVANNVSDQLFSDVHVKSKVSVVRLPSFPRLRKNRFLRYIEQLNKMILYLLIGIFWGVRRQVIIYSPPLPLAVTGILIAKLYRTQSIVNVQDLYPDTAIALGFMKNPLLIRLGRLLEKWVYRHADRITVHSEGNKKQIVQNGADEEKVSVIYNWVNIAKYETELTELDFRKKHNLEGRFVVSYAGVIGLAQGMGALLSAAKEYCDDQRVFFVMAGGGIGYDAVKEVAHEEGFKNILFLPHLSEVEYIQLLKSSDVCLVTLHSDLTTPAVPGKLQCIMAAGRPVICSVPQTSDAKGIVEQAQCGVWIDPQDEKSLSVAIGEMVNSDSITKMGEHGRGYANEWFDHKRCTKAYYDLLMGKAVEDAQQTQLQAIR